MQFGFILSEFEHTTTIPLGPAYNGYTFDFARSLRSGAHSLSKRLEQFSPVMEELFQIEEYNIKSKCI